MGKKEDIFAAGYELFSTKGFKPVAVSDIANLAGISVGSFYNYYQSKEALFIDVFNKENKTVMDGIVKSLNVDDSPADVAQKYLLLTTERLNKSLILKEWYGDSIGQELGTQYQNNSVASGMPIRNFLVEIVERWRKEGMLCEDIRNDEIVSIFDALVFLDANSDRIATSYINETIQWIVKFVALGITNNKEGN